ncbi:MAG: hypothetical protein KGN78_11100, partial [Actinomycetales bacterium]|nr:hypothetical protein [Actinomycetales bacterium]
ARLDAAIAAEVAARAAAAPAQEAPAHAEAASAIEGAAFDAGSAHAAPSSSAAETAAGSEPLAAAASAATPPARVAAGARFPRSKTLFATAASIAALALLIGRPWVHDTGSVVATGPTTSASDTAAQRGGATLATPRETMVQVSRHSYQRSSLAKDAAAFLSGQGNGSAIRASAAPKQWQAVTVCVNQTLSVLGAAVTSKVDLGWLDGKPSAIVVTSNSKTTADPATQVMVLQSVDGRCTIAARTTLTR